MTENNSAYTFNLTNNIFVYWIIIWIAICTPPILKIILIYWLYKVGISHIILPLSFWSFTVSTTCLMILTPNLPFSITIHVFEVWHSTIQQTYICSIATCNPIPSHDLQITVHVCLDFIISMKCRKSNWIMTGNTTGNKHTINIKSSDSRF